MELNPEQKKEIEEIVRKLRYSSNVKAVFIAETNGQPIVSMPYQRDLSPDNIEAASALLSSMIEQALNVEKFLHPNRKLEESMIKVVVYIYGEETLAIKAGQEAILIVQFSASGKAYSVDMETIAKKTSEILAKE